MHLWLDLAAWLSRAPVASIASIRGRARGAGREFALAIGIRLAGDKATLAQSEVGTGSFPMSRLPRLISRGLEAPLVADDIDAALADRYVDRVVADDGERRLWLHTASGSDSELERRLGELVTP
jgi:enoyl-CoA hydratase/carnithine racemase